MFIPFHNLKNNKMKTRMNIRMIAGMALTAATMVFSTAKANDASVKSALDNLDKINTNMEESIRYTAPVLNEIAYLDAVTAYELEVIEAGLDVQMMYVAPSVTEDVEDHEVKVAFETLDRLVAEMDESIKF